MAHGEHDAPEESGHPTTPAARPYTPVSGLLFCEQPQARLAQTGGLLQSDERVEHDFPDLLRGAAGDRELGSPLQRLLA